MRLALRIPTRRGPRTVSIPRLSPEDAALIGEAIAAIGGEFALHEDGASQTMPQVVAGLRDGIEPEGPQPFAKVVADPQRQLPLGPTLRAVGSA
jgi:hypothetical protein